MSGQGRPAWVGPWTLGGHPHPAFRVWLRPYDAGDGYEHLALGPVVRQWR